MDDLEVELGICPTCGAKGYSCETSVLSSTAVRISRLADRKETTMHKLATETYVNQDSTKVVPKGSLESAWLLGMAGDEISDETAARLGLDAGADAAAGDSPEAVAKEYSRADLLAAAEARGIAVPSKATKPEIVELLAADEAAKEAAAEKAKADEEASSSGTADQGAGEATDGVAQAEKPAEA